MKERGMNQYRELCHETSVYMKRLRLDWFLFRFSVLFPGSWCTMYKIPAKFCVQYLLTNTYLGRYTDCVCVFVCI